MFGLRTDLKDDRLPAVGRSLSVEMDGSDGSTEMVSNEKAFPVAGVARFHTHLGQCNMCLLVLTLRYNVLTRWV